MATKTSIYPNYYRVSLNEAFGNLPAGTDIGYHMCYTYDLHWLDTVQPQGNGTWSGYWNETFNDNYRYLGYVNFNPNVDAKQVTIPYKPVITWEEFTTSYQYFGCKVADYSYNATKDFWLWFRWKKSGNNYIAEVTLMLDDGTHSANVVWEQLIHLSATDAMGGIEIEAKLRYLIQHLELYIGGRTTCSRNSLSMTTYSNGFQAIFKYAEDAYNWIEIVNLNTSFGTIASESEEHIQPEPTPPPEPSDDPYNPGGYSGGGGGPNPDGTGATGTGGLHDDTSDTISTPSLPSSVSTGSGLFTAYNPSASQLAYFANKLWNIDPTTIGELFRLLFGGDAFNAIIGLHLLPVQPDTSGTPNIMLGNWDSEAPAPKIVNQYKQVSFGSLMLPEYWGNSIDYSPYTRIQLALPYIGIVDVDTDDVLGSNNTLTYNIDVLSGAICATLHCAKGNLNSVIYQWGGSCAVQLPITGASFNAVMGAIAGVGAAVGGAVAFASGPMGAALGTAGSLAVGSGLVSGSAANMFGSMKGKIQKSGGIGGNSGALGIMTPYFIITRPVQSVPASWQADKGYPSNISAQLGTVIGYTEVSEINLECSGTEAEKKEIVDLLKKGVIF